MGRIKSIPVKALGDQLLRQFPNRFSADFGKNKAALAKITPIKFKRVRNQVAGYIANEVKKARVPQRWTPRPERRVERGPERRRERRAPRAGP